MSGKPFMMRPHHGMCLAYFAGEGYNNDFAGHMGRILSELQKQPDKTVRLITGTDIFCAACPNNNGGVCAKPELTAAYDRAVLARCGVTEGAELPFQTFTGLVQARILAPGYRRNICGQCQWDDLCSTQPSRWE